MRLTPRKLPTPITPKPCSLVTLGIPVYDHITPEAYMAGLAMVLENAHNRLLRGIEVRGECFVAQSRNEIGEAFLKLYREKQSNLIWWVDADVAVPPGTLARMIDLMQQTCAPVVSALYCGRDQELHVYQLDPFVRLRDMDMLREPTMVDAVGLGCCLVDGSAMEAVKRARRGRLMFKYLYNVDDSTTGEDVYFCQGLARAGIKVLVDPKLVVGHIKTKVITPRSGRRPRWKGCAAALRERWAGKDRAAVQRDATPRAR